MNLQDATDELTDLIYAALLGETSWQDFVDRLSEGMPDGKSVLFFHDAIKSRGSYGLTSGLDDSAVNAHNSYYSTINPWMPRASVRKVGVGVIADEMLPYEQLVGTEFYNDFLLPNEVRSAVGVTIDRENGFSFLLSTMTSQTDPERNRPFADRLTHLAPHLRRASNFYRRGPSSRVASELGASLFDAIDVGLIVVGDSGRVKVISDTAQQMLESGTPLYVTPLGCLSCRCEKFQYSLEMMLERDYAGPKVVRLAVQGAKLTLIRVKKDHISLYFEGSTVIILVEQPGAATRPFDPKPFSYAYGLTKAEQRALSGIVAGKSIDQMAEAASRSRETIRSQVKSLYAKTGASNQADILRLIRAGHQLDF